MKVFYLTQVILTLLVTLVLHKFCSDNQQAEAFFLGSLFSTYNVSMFSALWTQAFTKKSVASTVFIIVLKYTILALIFYLIVARELHTKVGVAVGLGSIVFSFLAQALLTKEETEEIKTE